MECFNSLLLKLREAHEREVEGWQVKIQELSNKKGCDTKRMEELFTKNQQMKDQQRLLTENIKTLENRLRAGLCDRCTVTQEVAKQKQHEFEASQMQSLQHISLLAGEMNNLKKENKRLKDEIKILRTALHDHSSNSRITIDIKPNSSPDLSPSSGPGPVALITTATNRANNQPTDGDISIKTEVDQRTEGSEHKQWRSINRRHFDSYKPLSTPSIWRTEHSASYAGERKVQTIEELEQQSSIFLKNTLSTSGEVKSSRHVLHAPVPCRPQPIKSTPVHLPWSSSPGTSIPVQSSAKLNMPHFPNLIQAGQNDSPQTQGFGSSWHKQSTPKPIATEPTVLFRLRSLSEHGESQARPQEIRENPPSKSELVSAEELREVYEGPLDLSDQGKSKFNQSPKDYSPLAIKDAETVQSSPGKDGKRNPPTHGPMSSPLCPISPSSSPRLSVKKQEEESFSDFETKVIKEQEHKEEVNGNRHQSTEKKVPVLTISLRPVVVLETLNSALQKQESLSSNDKSSSQVVEPASMEQDMKQSVAGQETAQPCKRKRTLVETKTDEDLDTDEIQQERKIKIPWTSGEKSLNAKEREQTLT